MSSSCAGVKRDLPSVKVTTELAWIVLPGEGLQLVMTLYNAHNARNLMDFMNVRFFKRLMKSEFVT